jgi:hypothetical protein
MRSRQQKALKAVALFLVFAIAQVYVQISFAEPNSPTVPVPLPQQFIARLTTRGNQPITVNGLSAASGATILTGATIETPAAVGATINLGPLGYLDLAPNTKVELTFDENGQVRVKLISGCAILIAKKNTDAEVSTEQGPAGKTDKKKGGVLDICFPPGALAPTVGQGAAASAGAGAAGTVAAASTAGLSGVAIGAIVGGAIAAVAIPVALSRGNNSSSTTP